MACPYLTGNDLAPPQVLLSESVIDSFDSPHDVAELYHQSMSSVFTAPVSGNYSFWLSSDDHGNVYISDLQANSTASTQLVDFNSNCDDFFCDNSQRSAPVELVAGDSYLVKATAQETRGQDYLHLGILVPSDEPSYNSLREVQEVSIDAGITYELQRLDIPLAAPATGGFYQLYHTYTDAEGLAQTAQATVLPASTAEELEDLLTWVGAVVVSTCTSATSNGICFDVEFLSLSTEQRDLLEVRYAPEAVICDGSCGLDPGAFYPATRVADGSPPLGGEFTVTYGGATSAPLAWAASATDFTTALEGLTGIPDGPYYVSRTTSTAAALAYTVEFVGVQGPVSGALGLDVSGLTGGGTIIANSSVVVQGSYDRLLAPIPGWMLRTRETVPQLRVTSAGHPASCGTSDGTCPFLPTEALTPTVTSVREYLGPDTSTVPEDTRALVIAGSGFSTDIDGNKVTIANELCLMMAATEDSLVCSLPQVVTGAYEVVVNVLSKGFARHVGDAAPFTVEGELVVISVSPTSGSIGGGTLVTITGGVFPEQEPEKVSIRFEEIGGSYSSVVSELESISYNEIVFKTPPNSQIAAGYVNVVLSVSGRTHEFAFGYDEALSSIVTSITPNLVSAVEPTLLTIAGTGLGGLASEVTSITLAGDPCIIRSVEADGSETTCMWYPMDNTQLVNCDVQCERLVDGVPRTSHELLYNVAGRGLAIGASGALSVRVALEINSVSPDHGSLLGGTAVTITGAGFGTGDSFPNTVAIGSDYPASICDVTFANLTLVECVTRHVAVGDDDEQYQELELTIRNVPTECLAADSSAVTPTGTLPPLGSLANSPMYDTVGLYGLAVDTTVPPVVPTLNWPGDDGSVPSIEYAFPGIDPFDDDDATRRRGLLSEAECRFLYSASYTPIVSSAAPTAASGASFISITGSNWGTTDTGELSVYFVRRTSASDVPITLTFTLEVLGSPECTVTAVSSTEITCTAPAAQAGFYAVVVMNDAWGMASTYPVIELQAGITSVTPSQGPSPFLSNAPFLFVFQSILLYVCHHLIGLSHSSMDYRRSHDPQKHECCDYFSPIEIVVLYCCLPLCLVSAVRR